MSVCPVFLLSSPLSASRALFLLVWVPHPSHYLLLIYVAEEQLSRAGRKVGQAGGLQALRSSNTELIVSRTHTLFSSSHTSHMVTSIHIHLKARQEGVGSCTHISRVSIEVHQCELWHLESEKLNVRPWNVLFSNFSENNWRTDSGLEQCDELLHVFCVEKFLSSVSPPLRNVMHRAAALY